MTAAWSPRVDSVYPLERVVDAYQRLDAPSRVGKVVLDTRTVGATRPLTRGQLDPPIHHVDTWSP